MKSYLKLMFLLGSVILAWTIYRARLPSVIEFEDQNKNGVWDDVDRRIAALTKIEKVRKAVEQSAKVYQRILLHPENAQKLEPELSRSMNCIAAVESDFHQDIFGPITMRNLIVTGRARELAWIKFNVALSGGVYPGAEESLSACDF